MKIAFFGNPEFARIVLGYLWKSAHEIVLVVTNPDKPTGRHRRPQMTPVKAFALEHSLPVVVVDRLEREDTLRALEDSGADVVVVAAYGKILPRWLLEARPFGCVNVHASLLPLYRGAAPIERCLLDSNDSTGVSIMQMDEGMDTGPVFRMREIPVGKDDNADQLRRRLAEVGGDLLVKVLDDLSTGRAKAENQRGEPTFAPKIADHEMEIDWSRSAVSIHNQVRALSPKPGARTTHSGRLLKVLRSRLSERDGEGPPGTVVAVKKDLEVATGEGILVLEEVQPENKRVMSGAEYARGARLRVGDSLGL